MILIISIPEDEHAAAVLRRLNGIGAAATLLDLRRFPGELRLCMEYAAPGHQFKLKDHGQEIPLAECAVAWWRRPQAPELHSDLTAVVYQHFASGECGAALSGLWLALEAFWVNEPTLDDRASRKAYQLRIARDIGFEIPTTLITNDPESARAFVELQGPEKTVYKAFSATLRAWRETRVLRPEEMTLMENVRFAPVIFQEYIPADLDLRVTIVGDEIFPAAIHTGSSSYKADFRMDMNTTLVESTKLPAEIHEKLLNFMRHLGLEYGAIDMRLTPDGRYVFLEINPSGQWLFIEQRTGQPITESFTSLLVDHDHQWKTHHAGERGKTFALPRQLTQTEENGSRLREPRSIL